MARMQKKRGELYKIPKRSAPFFEDDKKLRVFHHFRHFAKASVIFFSLRVQRIYAFAWNRFRLL